MVGNIGASLYRIGQFNNPTIITPPQKKKNIPLIVEFSKSLLIQAKIKVMATLCLIKFPEFLESKDLKIG